METKNEILNISAERLEDEAVANVTGGKDIPKLVGGIVAVTNLVASGGTFIASAVYSSKGAKAEANGDEKKAKYYKEQSKNLMGSSVCLGLGAFISGLVVSSAVSKIVDGFKDEQKKN